KRVAALTSSLGFGPINNSDGTASGTRTVDLTGGAPAGYVNAILFGPRYGQNDANYDYFKVTSFTGSTVPEPSSVILLFTVAVLGFKLSRSARRPHNINGQRFS